MFENPFCKSPNKIVFCDVWRSKDEPAEMNSRFRCNETMNRLKYDAKTGYRPHQAHDPWFGIEQEYCVIDDADKPWEFQIGPCEGVTIGDHLYVARYILYRLAELYGFRGKVFPLPVQRVQNCMACG
uniref:Glutamine synthetase n=1 Tax=Magallana gigas TaxID=29159 RepID=K1QGC8_MAGGI